MNRLQILLLLCTFLFAFEISIVEAQGVKKVNEGECAGALQGEKALIEALEKMKLPNTPNPEKRRIDFWSNNSPVFNFRSEKEYTISSSNIIGAIDSARAFVNLWNKFPDSRNELIAIANEVSAMMESRYFGRREMHEVYEIIMNRLLKVYDNLQAQSENSVKVVEVASQHEMNHLLETLYTSGNRQTFESEGYKDIYIAGLDNANTNLRLARSLRGKLVDKSIDPHTLHIPEFAALIDTHIDFIERGIIESHEIPDKAERLRLLESLRMEAHSRWNLRKVTSRYWFNLNFLLSILASYSIMESKSEISYEDLAGLTTNEDIERLYKKLELLDYKKGDNLYDYYLSIYNIISLLNQFPERIMIPTIHDLGRMSINRTNGTGVHLIGLNNRLVQADNRYMLPYKYFLHDGDHAILRAIDDPQILMRIQLRLDNLSRQQREPVEYIYFEVDHENILRGLRDIANIREIIKELVDEHHRISNNSIDRYNNRINYNYVRPFLPFLPNGSMNTYLSFLLNDDYLMSTYSLSFSPNDSTRVYESIGEFLTEGSETFIRLVLEVHEELGINDSH